MQQLSRLWRGELTLESAFWTWAVFGGLLVNLSSSGLFLALITAEQPLAAFLAGYAYSVPYNLLVAVGVCRAADRYDGDPRKAELARILVIVAAVLLSVT